MPAILESPVEAGLASAYPVDQTRLVLIDPDDRVLDLHPFYQIVEDERSHYEPHIAFLKEQDDASRTLRCETIAAVEMALPGYDELSSLETRLVEAAPKT